MWLDEDKMTIVFALVSPLAAEGHLKFNYVDLQSLEPKAFANYVRVLPCPVHRS
jgi:hypothetical protein